MAGGSSSCLLLGWYTADVPLWFRWSKKLAEGETFLNWARNSKWAKSSKEFWESELLPGNREIVNEISIKRIVFIFNQRLVLT